ncbi:hypothetical protein [Aliivibrio finisterrensis]|uniref:DUF2645 family protein n=1 Tax=Aliivibrio finisterrensis TaxID=511998 RepID=A0ABY0I712_9GAMM|nr:hypothetical protein [Aliivibrio finisterrensis]RYU64316.1 hypothetical protein ERW53_10270 [Aliivibrio finisterrensis]RYU83928.1 hypothetical protein ERW52_12110 [Aliivibrio finisterrensis]
MKYSSLIRTFLLALPILWVLFLWLGPIVYPYLNHYDDFVYDSFVEYTGDGKKPSGFMSSGLMLDIYLFIYFPSLFINAIYTAYKKLWWWFGSYVLLFFSTLVSFASSIGFLG